MSQHAAPGKSPSPCRQACPAGVDVPRYIRQIQEGRFDAARQTVRERIPFSAVCGWACLHPCEARCARIQFDETIAIRMLKLAAEEYGRSQAGPPEKLPPSGQRIAIVGSGPGGLTAAYYLAKLGHSPVVFEAEDAAGGLLRYGIPSYRLPRQALNLEIDLIRAHGVDIRLNTPVLSPKQLFQDGFAAVLLAVGAWQPVTMGIPGEDSPLVVDGLSFLKAVNAGSHPAMNGKRVLVVGGGNTAIDAARSARRLGAEVTLLYRRRREDMPASDEEIEDALEEGVEIICHTAPIRVQGNEVTCLKMTEGPADAGGRPTPIPQEGSEYILSAGLVVVAIGQRGAAAKLAVDETGGGRVKADPETLATSIPGLFAAGDAVTGPSSIIDAIAQGRRAAAAIDRFLGGNGNIDRDTPATEGDEPETLPRGVARAGRKKAPPLERLRSFDQVEQVYDQAAAIGEAKRCLSCDLRDYDVSVNDQLCKECGFCQEVCSLSVFETADSFNVQGYRPTLVKKDARCIGCLRCLYICPDFAISIGDGKREDRAVN